MRAASVVGLLVCVSLGSIASIARADDPRARASLALGHAVGSPQDRELGFGIVGDVGIDVPVARWLGVEGRLGGVVLGDGSPPRDPRLADRPSGLAGLLLAGPRFGLRDAGPWADFGVGLAATGNARFAFDARAGWDFALDRRRWFMAGPMAGYLHVLQPDDTLRPEDAHVVFLGINVAYGQRTVPCEDFDRDGICDDKDSCPKKAGPKNDEDATKNGCPEEEREVVAERKEPVRERAPERTDRDNDGVFDDEDACPDIPGVRTEDRATNGCPPAAGPVRVEGDRIVLDDVILFDVNSPRVRHVSWPLVEKVAKFIIAMPDILEIDIEGHADRVGTDEHNLRLSRERAEAVKRLLVKYGVEASRVNARGFGESRPKTASRQAREDRRVEFWVVRARPASPGSKP